MERLLDGKPYRKGKPDGFRRIHRELAEARSKGVGVTLTILENCPAHEIDRREMELIKERGTLNGPLEERYTAADMKNPRQSTRRGFSFQAGLQRRAESSSGNRRRAPCPVPRDINDGTVADQRLALRAGRTISAARQDRAGSPRLLRVMALAGDENHQPLRRQGPLQGSRPRTNPPEAPCPRKLENVGEQMNTEQKPDLDKGDTISLRLDPAIARELRAEAERRGLGLEALVVEMWSLYRSRVD